MVETVLTANLAKSDLQRLQWRINPGDEDSFETKGALRSSLSDGVTHCARAVWLQLWSAREQEM